jgi:hypothetical protein
MRVCISGRKVVRSPGTFAELVAHVSIKMPRPLGLSRTKLVLYLDGEACGQTFGAEYRAFYSSLSG